MTQKDEIVNNLVDNLGSVGDQDKALANILGLLGPAQDPKDDEKTELEEDEIPDILDDPEGKALMKNNQKMMLVPFLVLLESHCQVRQVLKNGRGCMML